MSVDDEPVGAGNEETFQSVRELLIALGRDAQAAVDPAGELEGFVVDHVDHDLGNSLFVDLSIDGQIVMWTSAGVNMWALEFPFTRQEFYDFLDELDLRSTRMLARQGLPGRDDEDDEDWEPVQIPESLAAYLQVADSAFVEALGARWRLLDCEVDGYYSTPGTGPVATRTWSLHSTTSTSTCMPVLDPTTTSKPAVSQSTPSRWKGWAPLPWTTSPIGCGTPRPQWSRHSSSVHNADGTPRGRP